MQNMTPKDCKQQLLQSMTPRDCKQQLFKSGHCFIETRVGGGGGGHY